MVCLSFCEKFLDYPREDEGEKIIDAFRLEKTPKVWYRFSVWSNKTTSGVISYLRLWGYRCDSDFSFVILSVVCTFRCRAGFSFPAFISISLPTMWSRHRYELPPVVAEFYSPQILWLNKTKGIPENRCTGVVSIFPLGWFLCVCFVFLLKLLSHSTNP